MSGVPPSPRQNRLLAALPEGEYRRLLPALEPIPLPGGWMIHRADDWESHLYFIAAGLVARFHSTESGASKEFALTGSEGVIGIASFLGGGSTRSQAIVLSEGFAYRVPVDVLHREFEHCAELRDLLLRYVLALMNQIGQIAACSRHHTLEQRLARWILSCIDRQPSNELTMTQELMAEMLGVRREGVTEAARKLQEAGLIRYRRGHIVVLDRHRLERETCECYGVLKRADELLRASDRCSSPR